MGVINAPEPLSAGHDCSPFDCGQPDLNRWLQRKGLRAQRDGSARVYVVRHEDQVVGYYALASGAVSRDGAPGRVKRNMPDPIPVVLIGRLAVDHRFRGRNIGRGMLKDALLRVVNAAGQIGVRAVLVHALDEQARGVYLKQGFYDSPTDPMTLMLTVREVERVITAMG